MFMGTVNYRIRKNVMMQYRNVHPWDSALTWDSFFYYTAILTLEIGQYYIILNYSSLIYLATAWGRHNKNPAIENNCYMCILHGIACLILKEKINH